MPQILPASSYHFLTIWTNRMNNALISSGLFGGLFSDETIAAEFSAAAFTGRMLDFEAAWTRALAKVGAVTAVNSDLALRAIEAYDLANISGLATGSNKDGLPVPALVKELRSGLSSGPAQAIHSGATSQDVVDSAMALALLAVVGKLDTRLETVLAQLDDLVERFGDAPLMGRTRMQAALPATVALRVDAWRRPLVSHRARLRPLREEIGRVQVGGAVGRRDLPKDYGEEVATEVARQLGLEAAPVWHTDRSGPVTMGHWLTLVAGTSGKIGQDLALMAQQGVDELRLTDAGGSSAMPHKQNPVLAETMVALARHVATQQGALAQAMIHEQERSGVAWALEWLTLPAMAEATGAALKHLSRLLKSIERIGGDRGVE